MRPPKTVAAALSGAAILTVVVAGATASASSRSGVAVHPPSHRERVQASAAAANANVEMLQAAASDLVDEALASHALWRQPGYRAPVKRIYAAVAALEHKARREDPTFAVKDTTDVMGKVPTNLVRHRSGRPRHAHVYATHTLLRFTGHSVAAHPSMGNGYNRPYAGSWPATYRSADGVYVRPKVPAVKNTTVGLAAIHEALRQLGTPYVWAGGGPSVFDCSGLVQWAYAHAGISLGHYTGFQWNEGRLIPPHDILPGDLVLFGNPTHHVGIYLGAGWMVNAPYTGQYVDVVPVGTGVAGIIRP